MPLLIFRVSFPFFFPLIVSLPLFHATFAIFLFFADSFARLIPDLAGETVTFSFTDFFLLTVTLLTDFFPFFTLIEGFFTVTFTVADTPLADAVITAVPFFTALMVPSVTVATFLLDDVQVTFEDVPVTAAFITALLETLPVYRVILSLFRLMVGFCPPVPLLPPLLSPPVLPPAAAVTFTGTSTSTGS